MINHVMYFGLKSVLNLDIFIFFILYLHSYK